MRLRKGEKALPPIHANVGIAVAYRKRLLDLIAEMDASLKYWIKAAYRAHPPIMAQDEAIPAIQLRIALNKLVRQWNRRFDEAAKELAAYFAATNRKRSDAALMAILKKGGWTVDFKITSAMRDVMRAAIEENVSLIRSIPRQYLTQVAGDVYRSVQAGRDLAQLSHSLQKNYGVTKRRAAFIARDQSNKMTSVFTRVRQEELGIREAIWQHSLGGKVPRRTHLANNGNRYTISRGWFDPDPKVRKFIHPSELPNCRCQSRSIIKGFS
jgi:uncharacterized protein with gpF-like domain